MPPQRPAWLVPRHGPHFAPARAGLSNACDNGFMAAMKVTTSAAMRARDVSRPRAEHLAYAETAEADAVRGRPAAPAVPAPAVAAPAVPVPAVPVPAVSVAAPAVSVEAAGAE